MQSYFYFLFIHLALALELKAAFCTKVGDNMEKVWMLVLDESVKMNSNKFNGTKDLFFFVKKVK